MPVLAATQEECCCCNCKCANFCDCEGLSAAVHADVSASFCQLLIFCANAGSVPWPARRQGGGWGSNSGTVSVSAARSKSGGAALRQLTELWLCERKRAETDNAPHALACAPHHPFPPIELSVTRYSDHRLLTQRPTSGSEGYSYEVHSPDQGSVSRSVSQPADAYP